MTTHALFRPAISTSKVGHTDLVFGLLSGFISRSMCPRLQVSVCSGYDLCHPAVTQTHRHRQTAFWPDCVDISASWPTKFSWHV